MINEKVKFHSNHLTAQDTRAKNSTDVLLKVCFLWIYLLGKGLKMKPTKTCTTYTHYLYSMIGIYVTILIFQNQRKFIHEEGPLLKEWIQ